VRDGGIAGQNSHASDVKPSFSVFPVLATLVVLIALLPLPAAGQAGVVSGTIVDAESAAPLADASVTLEPRDAGALPAGGRAGEGPLRAARTGRTDAAGRYYFGAVAEGEYRLLVRRIGYRPATVEIALRGPAESRLSVGLTVQPVALEPVRAGAPARAANPYAGGGGGAEGAGARRVEVERMRQREHLAPDVRAVTRADVEEGVTLAETDLFRALQRLPGVGARDDYSAELLTRGAPWDHTRVYWDGVPLYHPVHTLGIFSGVNADAVGGVFLHPGAQPVSSGGGAAATLDVRSRRGGTAGARAGSAELSMASLRVAADGETDDGRHAWMLAARQSHVAWLTRRMEDRTRDKDFWATSRFADVAGRYDLRLGGGGALEASALWQRDVVSDGPDGDWLGGTRPRWGSLAARATLRAPLGPWRAELAAGTSRFDADVREREDAARLRGTLLSWPTLFSSGSRVRHLALEGRLEPPAAGAQPPVWRAGAGAVRQSVAFHGPPAYPLDLSLPPATVRLEEALAYGFAWAEGRWDAPGARLGVEAGVRVEGGEPVRGGGALRWAPRAAVRLRAGAGLTFSAAAGRSWQYVQAGPQLGEQAVTQHLWMLAGDSVPALVSDVATVGAEAWLGGAWLASVAAYERRSAGLTVTDPRPGEVVGRPLYAEGSLRAEGVELSVRRLAGRWTGSASYSWGVSTTRAAGLEYAGEGDQRHALDLAVRGRLGGGWKAGAAFTAASGPAFTRFYGGSAHCVESGRCTWAELPRAGEPGTLRAPAYASLDLDAEWSRDFGGWRLAAFLQVHNALARSNPARYNHSVHYARCGVGVPDPAGGCVDDVWSRGLPLLPVLGLRAAF
jgi:hypothetical protein